MRSISELLISTIVEERVYKFIEIHFVGRYIIIGGHYLIGNAPLFVNDIVENRVNSATANEVIAGHVILLADAVGAVFALTAVGIRPRKFHKGHIEDAVSVRPTPAALMEQIIN